MSFENLLILTFDGADLQYVIALDKKTGETVWKTNRSAVWGDENVPGQMAREGDLRKAHSTPFIANGNNKADFWPLDIGHRGIRGGKRELDMT